MTHYQLDYQKVHTACSYLTSLHHPRRIRIVDLLDEYGSMQIPDIAEQLNLDEGNIKRHLKSLKLTGVVDMQIEEKIPVYYLNKQKLKAVKTFISYLP